MDDITFHIVTPYKGPDNWLNECKHSVIAQNYPKDRVIHHVIVDVDNKGATRNHFETLQKIEPVSSNVVVHLDGDDYFRDPNALQIIANAYMDNDIWATYGDYASLQPSVCRPKSSIGFRESIVYGGWCWSHPRTFRAHLIPYLREDMMKDFEGKWYSSAPDVAIFCPVLELCGKKRVKYITDRLVYYRTHSNNEHANMTKLADQVRCAVEIYKSPSVNPL